MYHLSRFYEWNKRSHDDYDITKEIKGIGMLFIKTKVKTPLAWVTLNDSGYPV
jgi:hypothetical protein